MAAACSQDLSTPTFLHPLLNRFETAERILTRHRAVTGLSVPPRRRSDSALSAQRACREH